MNKRSFLKRAGLLTGFAILNPLKLLGLFKPEPPITETAMWHDDYIYFASPEPTTSIHIPASPDLGASMYFLDGRQWIPVED